MNLHEYQAKALFSSHGIPVPPGGVAATAEEAAAVAAGLGDGPWVVKAQAHTGGRGKAGGVTLAKTTEAVAEAARQMLGRRLVTRQTGPEGLPVDRVLVEAASDIQREFYLGALLDRARSRITFMASAEGGMEIEEVAARTPERILTTVVDPAAGLQPYQARYLGFGIGLRDAALKQFGAILQGLYRLYTEKDLSLVEINPLILTGSGDLLALDAKINLDDNALWRHPDLEALRDPEQEDLREARARRFGLNYIALDGDIGCMVNGAGLAMATMDLVKLEGGAPANFLDVGGGATPEQVAHAFQIILRDDKVKGILVNIFGGILRCTTLAKGICQAVKEVSLNVPLVVRLEGTEVEEGRKILENSGLPITTATDMTDAANKIVRLVS